jgi:acetoin utilization deacetylase AcuC-like enzyme
MASVAASANKLRPRTGYLFHELYLWHNAGHVQSLSKHIQPAQHWEHPETKRRLHNLIAVSGLLDELKPLKPRKATYEEITRRA